jgi:hypothetical protein
MPAMPIEERLAFLQAHYAERINMAVAEGRMDLVRDLANDYADEALELILESGESSQSDTGTVEILEFDGAWPHWRSSRTRRFWFWRQKRW